jgi:hypothetical protein
MDRYQAARIAMRMCNARGDAELEEDVAELTRILMASSVANLAFEIVNATLDVLKSEYDRVTPRILARACRERPVVPRRMALPAPEDESGQALRPIFWPERPNGREPYSLAEPDERERERMRVFYASAMLPACAIARPDLGIRADHVAQAQAVRYRAMETLEGGLEQIRSREGELTPAELEIARDAEKRLADLRRASSQTPPPMTPARRLFGKSLARLGERMSADGRLRCAGCGKQGMDHLDIAGALARLMDAGSRGATSGHLYCIDCRAESPPHALHGWLDPDVGLPPDELARLIDLEKNA